MYAVHVKQWQTNEFFNNFTNEIFEQTLFHRPMTRWIDTSLDDYRLAQTLNGILKLAKKLNEFEKRIRQQKDIHKIIIN